MQQSPAAEPIYIHTLYTSYYHLFRREITYRAARTMCGSNLVAYGASRDIPPYKLRCPRCFKDAGS